MSEERDTDETRETTRRAGQTSRNAHGGRPTNCTPEIAERVADLIRQYGFVQTVVNLVGIGERTHHQWVAKGEQDIEAGDESTPYAIYAQAIKRAKAEFETDNLERIREGAQGWQARAWLNERSNPELFANRQRVEHSGNVSTGAAPVLTPSEWQDRRARILGERETGPN